MSLVVYKSSAGSGKTFTLVKEYIRLVIENPDNFKHILAITFTNKAANEMKSRILLNLSGMAYGPDEQNKKMTTLLLKIITSETKLTSEEIRQRAKQVLANILHGYSNFAVSTIDSFVHLLVRSFARELKLPVGFDVELDQDKLITKAIELLLDKVGTDQNLTKTLVQFVGHKMEDEKSWNIEIELKKFTKILLKESSVEAIEGIKKLTAADYVNISRQLTGLIRKSEELLSRPGIEAMDLFQQNQLTASDIAYGNGGIYSYFRRFAEKDFSKPAPNTNVEKMLESGNWTTAKCPAQKKETAEGLIPQLTELLGTATAQAEKLLPDLHLFRLIQQNIYPTAVLSEIEKVMEEFRENENIVHISEFNKRISAIVNAEPIPFIYERLGEKFRHFMVDEFQDTSLLQWQNLLPLFENSLSVNNFNMIVGDGKQAIYRWRNGEVEQFAALPEIYNKPPGVAAEIREKSLLHHYREKHLNTNYRTRKEVVEFNNAFFEEASKHLSGNLQKIYLTPDKENPQGELKFQKQQVDPEAIGGRVQIEFLQLRELEKEEALETELEKILTTITALKHDSFQLNEIALLTRTNADAGNVARFLIDRGINVVTSEALRLSANAEVRFMINVMRFMNDPSNRTVATDILINLLEKKQLPLHQIHELLPETRETHPDGDHNLPLENIILSRFGYTLHSDHLKSLSLYEIAENLATTFRLNPSGSNPFVRFFMDTILDFTSKNDESIADFLEYWDEKGSDKSIVIPEETDAVKIMTIHKAKGLEFPVVIYPFANGNDKLATDEFWINPEIEEIPGLKTALIKCSKTIKETKFAHIWQEESGKSFLDLLNVLYVAMTRPSERMYLILHDKSNKGEWKTSNNFHDVADLFFGFLNNKNEWQNDKSTYSFGYAGSRIKKEEHRTQKTKSQWHSTELKKGKWRDKIMLSYAADKNWDAESSEKYRDHGILIHNIMAKIKNIESVGDAVQNAVIEGLLPESEKTEMEKKLAVIITSPDLRGFFDDRKQIINEKEIILNNGQILRPDRIVLDENETSVIDYKTGRMKEEHKNQVDKYASALSLMNYRNIRKYLVYMEPDHSNVNLVSW